MEPDGTQHRLDRILQAAARGDGQAWRLLVDSYSRRVYGLLLRQCGDRDLAAEITQATFVKVVQTIGRYREQGRFESWLFRIALNQLRDEMRRRSRQARTLDTTDARADEPSAWSAVEEKIVAGRNAHDGDPAWRAEAGEQIGRLRAAVVELPEADRQIIHLRHTAGLSFAQIAQALGQPLGTVLARGHRALAKLRKALTADSENLI